MALVYVSPGLYRDSKTGKLIKSTTGRKPDATAKPGASKPGNKKPAFGKKPTGILGREARNQQWLAEQNRKLGNIETQGPTGSVTYDRDPVTGEVTQTTALSQPQQQLFDTGQQLSQTGYNLATQQLSGYETFGPDNAFNQKMYDAVFGNLTKNVDRDYAREKAELEQTLYNRGIPLNPADPQYLSHMQALDEKYQSVKDTAANQATQTAFSTGLATQQQQMSDLAALQNQGVGLQMPQAPGYNAPQMQNTSPAEYDIAMKTLKAKSSGGGAPAAPESPFMNSLPPGYTPTA